MDILKGDSGTLAFELQRFANISNSKPKSWIEGTNDNDSIVNSVGSYTTIKALAGNDTIKNDGSWVSIHSGNGNDSIRSSGRGVTVLGSRGDDTIYTSDADDIILYYNGDGIEYQRRRSRRLSDSHQSNEQRRHKRSERQ